MLAYYGEPLSPNQVETAEGYLICKNVPIARVGDMTYLARELGLEGDEEITVHRYPDDVFSPAAMASFEGKDVTDTHPPSNLDKNTWMNYSRGHVENVRRDGDFLVADLHVKDPALISDIQNNVKREVSCGYYCDFVPDGDGYKQVNIRGNHVAVVPQGRAGGAVAIKDSAETARKGAQKMSKRTNAILALFGLAAKDATPEALDELTQSAAAMLEDAPAEKAPESAPIEDVKVQSVPKGDDLGTKLDRVLELLTDLMKKDEPEVKDEDCLDAEINKLESGETEEEKEEAVTVPMDKASDEDIPMDKSTLDAYRTMLKKVRPVVAKISDAAVKHEMVDALLSVTKDDTMAKVMKANQAAAKAAADQKPDPMARIDEIQGNYSARNPHNKKEG